MHYRSLVPDQTSSDFSSPPHFLGELETPIVVVTKVGLSEGDDLVTMCFGSHDFREGVEAFLAKRKPVWTGR